jgi:hypothetical protein
MICLLLLPPLLLLLPCVYGGLQLQLLLACVCHAADGVLALCLEVGQQLQQTSHDSFNTGTQECAEGILLSRLALICKGSAEVAGQNSMHVYAMAYVPALSAKQSTGFIKQPS